MAKKKKWQRKKNGKEKKSRTSVGGWMSGSILQDDKFVRRLPILGFAGICMLIYMAIGFAVQKRYNYIEELNSEISKLRTVSITTAALRAEATRITNIEKLLQERGILLEPNTEAPVLIVRK